MQGTGEIWVNADIFKGSGSNSRSTTRIPRASTKGGHHMTKLGFSLTGLSEYTISFENYCTPCPWRAHCKFGRDKPLEIEISCKELRYIEEELQFQLVSKVQKEGGDIEKATSKKTPASKILSEVWQKKIKTRKDEIYCLNTNHLDLILVSNRSKDWWSDFAKVGKEIMEECSRIF